MIGVGILNHNCNDNAIRLARKFRHICVTYMVDSASDFQSDQEKKEFDRLLPNVYYSGMINEIIQHLKDKVEIICFIASDVTIEDTHSLYRRLEKCFADPTTGIYAPSVNKEGSNHPQMRNNGTKRINKAIFVDGFCFAVRTSILKRIYPINVTLNKIGWGLDVYLSYLSMQMGMISVVDHSIMVHHVVGPNNHQNPSAFIREAKEERSRWFENLSRGARIFQMLCTVELLKNPTGAHLITRLPW